MLKKIYDNIGKIINKKNFIAPKWSRINIKDLIDRNWEIKISMQTFYDLYRANTDIRSSVREISKAVGKNGMYLQDKNKEVIHLSNEQEIFSIFEYPTLYDFILNTFKHSFIAWELYLVPEYQGESTKVVWVKFIDPRTITKYIDKSNWNIVKFVQNILGKDPVQYMRDEIAYFQFEQDPNNTYQGLSLIEWIVWEWLSDLEASKHNFYFFKNNWVPNAIFMLDWEWYTEEEMSMASDRIKSDLTWSENAHKFIISNWIKDVKTIALSNRDIEFINLRKLTTDKVCATFWVPKNILWYVSDVNFSNGVTMSQNYVEYTIQPNAKYVEYIVNTFYNKFVDKKLYSKWITIKFDSENVDKREFIEKGQREDVKLWIITINEIRQERWLEIYKASEANEPIISSWFTLLEDITADININTNETTSWNWKN